MSTQPRIACSLLFLSLFTITVLASSACATQEESSSGVFPTTPSSSGVGEGGARAPSGVICGPSPMTTGPLPDGICAEAIFSVFWHGSDAEFIVGASALCTKDPTTLRGLLHFRIQNYTSLAPGRYPVADDGVAQGTAFRIGDGFCSELDRLVSGEITIADRKNGSTRDHVSALWKSGMALELDLGSGPCDEFQPDAIKSKLHCPIF